jgi:hypothetical protein
LKVIETCSVLVPLLVRPRALGLGREESLKPEEQKMKGLQWQRWEWSRMLWQHR